jgi:hypothetical protein
MGTQRISPKIMTTWAHALKKVCQARSTVSSIDYICTENKIESNSFGQFLLTEQQVGNNSSFFLVFYEKFVEDNPF